MLPMTMPSDGSHVDATISESQAGVDAANLPEFVRVRKMSAVPGHQKIAFAKRRNGQMQRIARGIGGHDFVLNVNVHDFGDFILDGQQRQIFDQCQSFGASFWNAERQFTNHGRTDDKFVFRRSISPRQSSPLPASNDVRRGSLFVVDFSAIETCCQ